MEANKRTRLAGVVVEPTAVVVAVDFAFRVKLLELAYCSSSASTHVASGLYCDMDLALE